MVKSKVLVTGGSGYIGARLCKYLAIEGYSVTSVCHSKIPKDDEWIDLMDKVIIGDVKDECFWEKLAETQFDVLIHLVSLDQNQSNGNPSFVSSVNVIPVWNLLHIFSNAGLSKFIYLSTSQIYGFLENEVVLENRVLKPLNSYALTHNIGELLCEYYSNNKALDCRIVRLSNSYGSPIFHDNNCWGLVINDLCRMAFYDNKIVLQSDGSPLRDFIHGWDVCKGIKLIIETSNSNLIYNLCSGETYSIMDIAIKIKRCYETRYGKKLELIACEDKSVTKILSNSRLSNDLIRGIGFEPLWSLEDGINELFDYFELNNG